MQKHISALLLALLFVSCAKSGTDLKNICSKMKDAVFAEFCRANFDKDGDGVVSQEEAAAVKEIKCPNMDISSLEGIEEFPNVEVLDVSGNKLVSLDLTQNTKLRKLNCGKNVLVSLLLPASLTRLSCAGNKLSVVDLSFTRWKVNNYVTDVSDPYESYRMKEHFYQLNDVTVYCTAAQLEDLPQYQQSFGDHETTFSVKP